MWGLSSPAQDWTCVPCIGRWTLNHWTTKVVPRYDWLVVKTFFFNSCLIFLFDMLFLSHSGKWGILLHLTWESLLFYLKLSGPKPEHGLPRWLSGKVTACDAGDARDLDFIPGWGRSPGERNGNPLQYSCLGNMDRGAWWAAVHRVGKSQKWQSD